MSGLVAAFYPDGFEYSNSSGRTLRVGDGLGENRSNIDTFGSLIDAIEDDSKDLAQQLRKVPNSGNRSRFDATANLLEIGLGSSKSGPLEQTIQILQSDLKAREFIEQSDDFEMVVTKVEDGRVISEIKDSQHPPTKGLEFKLYTDTSVHSDGDTETFREWVGTLQVVEVQDNICLFEPIDWDEDLSDNPTQRANEIMTKNPKVKVGVEGAGNVDWEQLEEVYEYLSEIKEEGGTNYAN